MMNLYEKKVLSIAQNKEFQVTLFIKSYKTGRVQIYLFLFFNSCLYNQKLKSMKISALEEKQLCYI